MMDARGGGADGDVVRMMDGYELSENFVWITLSDELPCHVDVGCFKNALDAVTEPYPVFHLSAQPPLWKKLHLKPSECVFEVHWKPREPVESMDAIVTEGGRSWFVEVSNRPLSMNKCALVRVKLHVNHSLSDGRTMGMLFSVIMHALLNSMGTEQREALMKAAPALKALPPLPAPCDLCAFGQVDNYDIDRIPRELLDQPVPSWKLVKPLEALPRIKMPDHYVGDYAEYPLKLWSGYAKSFASRNSGVRPSLQSAFMAADSRAMRKYCKLDTDAPVITEVVFDGRNGGYAKPAMHERAFFCGAGSAFIEVRGKGTWEEDIRACTELLRGKNPPMEAVAWALQLAAGMNRETGEFKNPAGMPSTVRENVVITTNIGRYDGTTVPRVGVHAPCDEKYVVCQYIWSTPETIYVLFFHPKTLDHAYVQTYLDSVDELFSFLSS